MNVYQYQKAETEKGETETERTHCIGYKITADLKERGFRGRGEKLKPIRDYQKKNNCRKSEINGTRCSFEVSAIKRKIKQQPCVAARSKCRK